MRQPIKKVVPEPETAHEHQDTGVTHIIVISQPITDAARAKILKRYPGARIVEQA